MVLLELCWMQKQFPYIPFSMAAPGLSIHAVPQPPQNRAVNELSLAEPGPAAITSLQRFASLPTARSSLGWSPGMQGRQSCSPLEVTNDLTMSHGLAAHVGWYREPRGSWHHGWSCCLRHLFAVCQQQALARCLLVPGFPCTWLAVLATASLFAFVVFPLLAGVLSPPSPSSPSFPQTCRHEPPAMSGSQVGAATSAHCRRDKETGNTIPINPGKAGKEPILVGLCKGLKRQRVCNASALGEIQFRLVTAPVLIMCLFPVVKYWSQSESDASASKQSWFQLFHSYIKT